jgi:hypothetical protein
MCPRGMSGLEKITFLRERKLLKTVKYRGKIGD